jgi:hypothetical protein
MERSKQYVPNVNDLVLLKGAMGHFAVTIVNARKRTAGVRTAAGPMILYHDVAWSKLSSLEQSNNVKRIGMESTKG